MSFKTLMCNQNESFLFSKLPDELLEKIFTTDKDVLGKMEQTCQLAYQKIASDTLVTSANESTDQSAWSKVRRKHFNPAIVGLPQIREPQKANIVCRASSIIKKDEDFALNSDDESRIQELKDLLAVSTLSGKSPSFLTCG